ncbi:hypothetical protein PTHTG4_27010 [Parageobacillus thermoglucosidasius]|nr:hypothetical protein PTHTG4_27010 [Parageobacillus thermoglucosidasius]
MRNLIKTIKMTTMLYRQPRRIGDVIEYQGKCGSLSEYNG